MKIEVRAHVYPTEDPSRILEALKYPFPDMAFETEPDGEISRLRCVTNTESSLGTLRNLIHENRVIDAARRILEMNWSGVFSSLQIDKQAAYRNKLRIIDLDDEPPLGFIDIIVTNLYFFSIFLLLLLKIYFFFLERMSRLSIITYIFFPVKVFM